VNSIDTIVFDYGGVLADHYVEPFQSQLGEILHATQKETRELTSEKSPHGRDYRLGKIKKEDFWNAIKKLSGTDFDIDFVHDLFEKTYMPNPAMISLIKFLKDKKGIQIGLGLNEDVDRWEHVRELINADQLSSVNVISFEIGALKPEKKFYEEMLKKSQREKDPSRVLYVDDRQTHVDAAISHGMQAYHFTSPGDFATALHYMKLVKFSL
jgi:FMN phosphatase YigB (HAD superfamily)